MTYPFKADDICYTCYIVCYGESRLAPPYSLKMLTYWPLSAKLNSWCPRMFNFMCYDPGQGKTQVSVAEKEELEGGSRVVCIHLIFL